MSYKHDMEKYVSDNWPGVTATVTLNSRQMNGEIVALLTFEVHIVYSKDLQAKISIPMAEMLAKQGFWQQALDESCNLLMNKQRQLDETKRKLKQREIKQREDIFNRDDL